MGVKMNKFGLLIMSKVENESYQDLTYAKANIGDAIQTIAIRYLFAKMNIRNEDIVEIGIDELKKYDGDPVNMPLIGVFERNTVMNRFPCSPKINPIFICSLMYDDVLKENEELINYLQKYAPIGCRDERTRDIFRQYDIDAYMMGCISLVLPKRDKDPILDKVFLIDIPHSVEKFLPITLKEQSECVCHEINLEEYPISKREYLRIESIASQKLETYRNEAGLVITSRLHAAAPCIAMGIPTIVVSNNFDYRFAWIDKFTRLYSVDEFSEINWAPEKADIENIRKELFDVWKNIITGNLKEYKKNLVLIDDLYMQRIKTDYFKSFKKTLSNLEVTPGDTYAIWGAGQHCDYIIMLMNQIWPEVRLKAIFDKYKRGSINCISITDSEKENDYNYDFIFITTLPGMKEAIKKLEQKGKKRDIDYFIMISKEAGE